MSADTPHVDVLAGITPALEPAFRLDQLVALSPERALYKAWDRRLKRAVALRLHLVPGSPGRDWFLRETETLAALDHPAIRHVYALGEVWRRRSAGARGRFPPRCRSSAICWERSSTRTPTASSCGASPPPR